jgi:hypothetical protein
MSGPIPSTLESLSERGKIAVRDVTASSDNRADLTGDAMASLVPDELWAIADCAAAPAAKGILAGVAIAFALLTLTT